MDYLDMLAKLGIGNAHPGGFAATLKQLEQYPIPLHSRVLEVGCGTGRTACYLASQGYEVTAIDIRPQMVQKAMERASKEALSVSFKQGDATSLPFPDESFDVVLVESVTIFTDSPKALSEYYRVLRPGGMLYDREMLQLKHMPKERVREIKSFYRLPDLWNLESWMKAIQSLPFRHTSIDGPYRFPEINEDLAEYPDHHQPMDSGALFDPSVWDIIHKYHDIMNEYQPFIGYILLVGEK